MNARRCAFACLWATALCVLAENHTSFDASVQHLLYRGGEWLISDSSHKAIRGVWYTGPKILIGVVGGTSLLLAALSVKIAALRPWRRPLLLLALCIAVVPLVVATAKAISGVRSPRELIPFGGHHPHIGMFAHLLQYHAVDGGRSFPAGHASGGFALMALYYLPVRRWLRYAGLGLGVAAGWGMGLYQMARGEHFLTHTLTTMFLAWAVILFIHGACTGTRGSVPTART